MNLLDFLYYLSDHPFFGKIFFSDIPLSQKNIYGGFTPDEVNELRHNLVHYRRN